MAATRLPNGPKSPAIIQAYSAATDRRRLLLRYRDRYGSAFRMRFPTLGHALVVSDPAEVRELFMNSDLFGLPDMNLGSVLGPGSLFAREGADHRRERKLLVPSFNGRRLATYEALIEAEAVKEMATWPQGHEFPVMESMMRITLNAILRAVLGAEGVEFDELRALMPRMVNLGSILAVAPIPRVELLGFAPWGRLNRLRAQYDAIIDRLIEKAHADPAFDERSDVLAIMLQSSYDDGSKMSNSEIADELLTMLAAGHETTATTLAWAVERLRRHPEIVSRLAAEVASGGSGLLAATITEVQRSRPVIDGAARQATVDGAKLGRWTLPKGQTIFVSATLLHENEELFPNPHRFYPDRFLDVKVDPYTWIPFGGGTRRCIGAAFAQMEMNIVLRTLIRDFELEPTSASDEAWRSRGVAWSPKEGGLAVVFRRSRPLRAAEDAAPESASADKRAAGRAKARPVKKAPAPLSSAADGTMSQAGTTP